jgi:hypothetical protein
MGKLHVLYHVFIDLRYPERHSLNHILFASYWVHAVPALDALHSINVANDTGIVLLSNA